MSTGVKQESRDSGVEFEEYNSLQGPFQVQLPPSESTSASVAVPVRQLMKPTYPVMKQHTNLSYYDSGSSKEGSLDELSNIIRPNKRDDDQSANNLPTARKNVKKKRKISFNRQTSKESQRSAGTVSLSSIKDAFKRNDYKEHKEEDTEEDEL